MKILSMFFCCCVFKNMLMKLLCVVVLTSRSRKRSVDSLQPGNICMHQHWFRQWLDAC